MPQLHRADLQGIGSGATTPDPDSVPRCALLQNFEKLTDETYYETLSSLDEQLN